MRATALLLAMSFWTTVSSGASARQAEELQRAMRLYDSGNYGEALALYRTLLEVEPKNATLLYEAGLTAKAAGDLNSCIAYATEAVATKELAALSLALLGTCQDDAGDSKAALDSFERGLAVAPADSQLNYNYALTLARLGRVAESRKHAGISIEGDVTRASAYLLYAATLDSLKLDGAAALMRLRFMTLELHTSRALEAATAIVKRAAEYRKQGQDKKLVLDGLPPRPGPDTELAVLNLAFGLAVATEEKNLPGNASDAARFVNAMQSLLTVTAEMQEKAHGMDFVWQHAAAPLQEFSRNELLQAFLYMVAGLAKLDGAHEWLEDHPKEREKVQSALRAMRVDTVTRGR
jgi:tetratricopeptide (TPR) repeat protein